MIDTNTVIDYLDNKLPEKGMQFMHKVIDNVPLVSVITKIEILRYNAPENAYKVLTDFMADSTVLDLDNQVVDETITICKTQVV